MGDDTDPVEPQGRNYSTHPIRALLSTLGTHLPPGWSWHYVDGNAFAFILAKATFDLTTWSTHWDETVLLQVWSLPNHLLVCMNKREYITVSCIRMLFDF